MCISSVTTWQDDYTTMIACYAAIHEDARNGDCRKKGGELPTVKVFVARPINPRLKDVHTGTKRRLDVKTSNRDSGILGSGYYLL